MLNENIRCFALRNIKVPPFELSLKGAGTFGPDHAPRVLWSAISGDLAALTSLYQTVIQATRPLGFIPEDRPYKAHITLARGFAGGEGSLDQRTLDSVPAGAQWRSDRFVLMRTHMHASPMYERIGEYPLLQS